jgi:hypothetical protein
MTCEYSELGGMGIGKENASIWRKSVPLLLRPPQIPTWPALESNPGRRGVIPEIKPIILRFEAFMAVTMKNGVFCDVTPCGSCKNRRFE